MPELALTVDLTKRALSSSLSDSAPLVLGDKLRVALAFTRNDGTSDVPADLPIRSLRCSLGPRLAPPTAGTFSFTSTKLDTTPVTVSAVAVGISAADLLTALAGLGWVTAVVLSAPSCWVLTSSVADTSAAPPAFTVTSNAMLPIAFARCRQFKQDGYWCVEIRCIVAPYAFASIFDRELPPPPSITRVRSGSTSGDAIINEIQSLFIPKNFAGLYSITYDYKETIILGLQDGPDAIAAALNNLFTDGKTRFAATLPADNTIYLEAKGPLAGTAIDLLTVNARSTAPGAPNFLLDLNTNELATALRTVDTIADVPFECEADIVEDGQDPTDMDNVARTITLWQDKVVVIREQIWAGLSTVPDIDWQRPPTPTDYVPFTLDQILTGQQQAYSANIGDGAATSFTIDHNLASAIVQVIVLRIADKHLMSPTVYTVVLDSANSLTISGFGSTPSAAQYSVLVVGIGPASVFQTHTHTIGQIVGLQAALDAVGARLTTIETLIPTVPLAAGSSSTGSSSTISIPLSPVAAVLPGVWPSTFSASAAIATGAGLPSRGRGLLPAIHKSSATNASLPLGDPSAHAGTLWTNNTADPIVLPGGLGRRSTSVAPGGFYASDGRVWYRVTRDVSPSGTTSYFPTDLELPLFTINITDRMLRAGNTLTLAFDLVTSLLQSNTRAQWLVAIECGATTQDTSPSTTGENLAALTWQTDPMLLDRMILADTPIKTTYGVQIARAANGTDFTAAALTWGKYEASSIVPAGGNFTLRGRLFQFDTEDSVALARGYAAAQMSGGQIVITTN